MNVAASVWRAIAGNPLGFLRSSWPWRSLAYVASTVAVAGAAWVAVLALLLFPPLLLLIGMPIGALERHRLRLLTSAQVRNPHATAPGSGLAWARLRVREASTWRELGYFACLQSVLLLLDTVALFVAFICVILLALPLFVATMDPGQIQIDLVAWSVDTVGQAFAVAALVGVPATVVTLYGISVLAGGQAEFARWLLAPTGTELSRQMDELAQSRNRLVNAFEAERRRIERDLHDGAQQHLLLLTMNLSLAEMELAGKNERTGELVGVAHQQARMALAAIREQIRGIHPQILTDFGLAEAVRELAERCPIPVEVDLVMPSRPSPAVESTAYFVVSEALTNVVRHAAATCVQVTGGVVEDRLVLTITDDGRGGADPALGTGIRGLADRVAVMDGTLEINSPRGGPTVVRIDLPCRCG
ncbi:sensor histidine kinase [Micromonospora sp. NBC_01412]|uniref:sensor histidine kinase n=1 Tax=Micromonospora sp. NBC_01412 TaxID=2903590 RepID=UPI0032558462